METLPADSRVIQGIRRREVLKAGVAAGVALSAWSLPGPSAPWGAAAEQPKRGGILRVRGFDPPHFSPFPFNFKTHSTLSFVYSGLVRYKVSPEVPPGIFIVEPELAERWETPDETTYVFHLRQAVRWHNKPPVHGRELVAEDVKFTFDHFFTEKGNPLRSALTFLDRIEVVDRYTVQFILKEPFVWLLNKLVHSQVHFVAYYFLPQIPNLRAFWLSLGTEEIILTKH